MVLAPKSRGQVVVGNPVQRDDRLRDRLDQQVEHLVDLDHQLPVCAFESGDVAAHIELSLFVRGDNAVELVDDAVDRLSDRLDVSCEHIVIGLRRQLVCTVVVPQGFRSPGDPIDVTDQILKRTRQDSDFVLAVDIDLVRDVAFGNCLPR